MRRIVLRAALALVVLVLVTVVVAMTSETVARYLVGRAAEAVPALSLSYRDGTLWSGIGVTAVSYRSAGLDVTAESAEVRWSLGCLASGRFCLERIAATQVEVAVEPDPDAAPASDVGGGMPVLPVDILFREVDLQGLSISTPQVSVAVASVGMRGSLTNDGLHIVRAVVAEPVVTLHEDTADTSGADEAASAALPEIASPLPVTIGALRVERPAVVAGGERTQARRMELRGRLTGQRLTVERYIFAHDRGELQLSGSVRLTGDYPLSLQLRIEAPSIYEGRDLRGQAELAGSVADLGVRAQFSGLVEVRLDGQIRPLEPELPYSATLRTARVGWPLGSAEQQVSGRDVRFRLDGDLSGYTLSGSGALAGSVTPALEWRIDARGDWQRATIRALELTGLEGAASIAGEVSWSPRVSWRADVEADGLQLSRHWPQAPDSVSGTAAVSGHVNEQGWTLDLDTPGVRADYMGRQLSAEGRVGHRADGQWRIDPLLVESGGNRVRASGTYDGAVDLTAELDLPEPGLWVDGLSGGLTGSVTVRGDPSAPTIETDVDVRDLAYQDVTVNEARIELRVEELGKAPSRAALTTGAIVRGGQQLDSLSVELTGTRQSHDLAFRADAREAALELAFTGGLQENMDWQGRLEDAAASWQDRRWELDRPAELRFDRAALQLSVSPHCWSREQTSLCMTEEAHVGRNGEVAVAVEDMPLGWVSQWLPEGFSWSGRLSGQLGARWTEGGAPRLQAAFVSRDGLLSVADGDADTEGDAGLPLSYERLEVEAELDERSLLARVQLDTPIADHASVRIDLQHALPGRPLDGRIRVEGVMVDAVQPFFPRIETLRGRMGVVGDLGGTLQSPAFNGELTLRDGELLGPELPMHVEGLELTARVDGRRASFDGRFLSDGEEARLTGTAAWEEGADWSVDAQLEGERLRVQYAPIAVVRVSPDLVLKAGPGEILLTGRIDVPQGELTLRQLPKGAVTHSTDVVVVRGPGAVSQEDSGAPNGLRINTNIDVVLGDEVRFSGMGAEGRLTGRLRIRQVAATTAEATGEIRIVEASFEAYGQELDIRSGRLIFAGPVTQPQVEIEAVRRVETVVVGLRVEGPAREPEITLFSEPPMPEEQILSYLVTGRAYGEAGPGEDAAMAQAAVALGVFTTRGTASDIASELGVEDFALSAEGEGEDAQVAVSGYIAPNLLVKYGVGVFNPQNTLTLRYNVTRNIYLEAVSGLENAIDAFYTFSF